MVFMVPVMREHTKERLQKLELELVYNSVHDAVACPIPILHNLIFKCRVHHVLIPLHTAKVVTGLMWLLHSRHCDELAVFKSHVGVKNQPMMMQCMIVTQLQTYKHII